MSLRTKAKRAASRRAWEARVSMIRGCLEIPLIPSDAVLRAATDMEHRFLRSAGNLVMKRRLEEEGERRYRKLVAELEAT